MWNNKDDKVYRIYQVVEESTGLILEKKNKKKLYNYKSRKK